MSKPGPAQLARIFVWRSLACAYRDLLRSEEAKLSPEDVFVLAHEGIAYAQKLRDECAKLGVRIKDQ